MIRLSCAQTVVLLSVLLATVRGSVVRAAEVTGTVSYREKIALPEDATIEVRLEDVSLQDAPAKTIGKMELHAAGKQVPFPFRIPYQPGQITPTHSYAVRATIFEKGSMIFVSTMSYPVITRGAPVSVAIVVSPVQASPAADAPRQSNVPLEGTKWRLIDIGATPAAGGEGTQEAVMILTVVGKRMAGSSGCNRMFGTYHTRESSLHFDDVGSTLMACPGPLMKQEQELFKALKATTGYRIEGESLQLLKGTTVLARFRAEH